MFFLTNLYERRLNENMNRHRLDAKIAPSRPKPSCRPIFDSHTPTACEQKANAVVLGGYVKEKNQISVGQSSPPPAYQDSGFFESKPEIHLSSEGQSTSMLENKQPIMIGGGFKPLARSGSEESGFFTGRDSDVASNVSFSA